MLGAIMNAVAILDMLVTWGLGWRYILSPRFRAKVHADLRNAPKISTAANLGFALVFFVLINGAFLFFLIFTALWLYRSIVVPRLAT